MQENFDLEWDIFYLGSWCRLIKDEKTHIEYVWRIRDIVYGGHGYLVNPKSLPKIIELVKEKAKETEIIDSIYCHLVPYLKMYAFIPGMVSQIRGKSDIRASLGTYPEFFSKLYGEHIFSYRLTDFKYNKTNKIYLLKYDLKFKIRNYIIRFSKFLNSSFPRVYRVVYIIYKTIFPV